MRTSCWLNADEDEGVYVAEGRQSLKTFELGSAVGPRTGTYRKTEAGFCSFNELQLDTRSSSAQKVFMSVK